MSSVGTLQCLLNSAVATDGGSIALFLSDPGKEPVLLTLNRSLDSIGTDRYNHVCSRDGYLAADAEIRLIGTLKRILALTPAEHSSYGTLAAFIEHLSSVYRD